MSVRIAVIGSGGYVGAHLCRALRAAGDAVLAYSSAAAGGIDRHSGLLPADFELPREVEAVVYLAQSPWVTRGSENPGHVLAVNVVSAVVAATAAQRAGAARFVYASTGNVYAPSFEALAEDAPVRTDNWYSLSKVHAEQALALCATPGFTVHSLRLFGVYGPGQTDRLVPRIVERVARGEAITLAPGTGDAHESGGLRLSVTYIDDLTAVIAQVARRGGPGLLNVAAPQVVSILDIAQAAGRLLAREPVFEPAAQARAGDLVADTRLLQRTFEPRFRSFQAGLESMLATAGTAV